MTYEDDILTSAEFFTYFASPWSTEYYILFKSQKRFPVSLKIANIFNGFAYSMSAHISPVLSGKLKELVTRT